MCCLGLCGDVAIGRFWCKGGVERDSVTVVKSEAVNRALDYSHKIIRELEKSLGEAHEGLKNAQDDLSGVQSKNIHFSKEYVKIVEFSYSIMKMAFENSHKQVVFFQLEM
ncbi:unnamed protein product [Vicia faba]|uniref:Uncharacterized protein n=1 Tax=Vicia faba TaxID=3906 RepID=A0AAV0YX29_VICFA|nr:unnamed protein product [Vicia faba]